MPDLLPALGTRGAAATGIVHLEGAREDDCCGRRDVTELERVLSGDSRWCLLEGDWRESLKALPSGSVDHVITDPPYSEQVHTCARTSRRDQLPDRDIYPSFASRRVAIDFEHMTQDEREAMADEIERVTKRWALIFSDVESCGDWRGSFTEWDYVRTGAWVRVGGAPQFSGDRPAAGFETVTIMHPKGRKRWSGGGHQAVWEHPIVLNRGGNLERFHPTQKPLDLMLRLVEDFTDPGDIILDPYAGSGTTGVAALRLGRRVILCERKPEYATTCRERMMAEEGQQSLRSLRSGQLSLLGGSQ